jgi:predicted DNA-binding transcriptional regulator AlpA
VYRHGPHQRNHLRRAGLLRFRSRSAILERVTVKDTAKITAPQVAVAEKAARLRANSNTAALSSALAAANAAHIAEAPLAADSAHHQHDRQHVRGARAPPAKQVTAAREATNLPMRLLNRHEIVALSGFTYPSLWEMMRRGKFPRGRVVGGKTMWRSDEIERWVADLPVRPLKGDGEPAEAVA